MCSGRPVSGEALNGMREPVKPAFNVPTGRFATHARPCGVALSTIGECAFDGALHVRHDARITFGQSHQRVVRFALIASYLPCPGRRDQPAGPVRAVSANKAMAAKPTAHRAVQAISRWPSA